MGDRDGVCMLYDIRNVAGKNVLYCIGKYVNDIHGGEYGCCENHEK